VKTLIVYDSVYGNTETIARAIGNAIPGNVELLRVTNANPAGLAPFDLLIVGAPTQRGKATAAIRNFIAGIPALTLDGAKVATFDTRVVGGWATRFGYAAPRIADDLKKKGATLAAPPEGFAVGGTKGPLGAGEVDRAGAWAEQLGSAKAT
jgi:flavodoxin